MQQNFYISKSQNEDVAKITRFAVVLSSHHHHQNLLKTQLKTTIVSDRLQQ